VPERRSKIYTNKIFRRNLEFPGGISPGYMSGRNTVASLASYTATGHGAAQRPTATTRQWWWMCKIATLSCVFFKRVVLPSDRY